MRLRIGHSSASPAEAIVAATSRPAEALGLKDVGTLSEGKTADFVAECESTRRYPQHAPDRERLPARRAARSKRPRREVEEVYAREEAPDMSVCDEPPPPRLLEGIAQFNRGEHFEQHDAGIALAR
jgi:hypothetical protein